MISKFYKKKPKALAAFLSAAVLFGAVCPKVFQAYDLDGQNDWQHEAVVPTWQDDKIAEATRYKLVPTGLGFNSAPYPGWREPGGSFWPLGAETFLQKRSGWDNTGFEMFEGRHTYCTGNHINAAGMERDTWGCGKENGSDSGHYLYGRILREHFRADHAAIPHHACRMVFQPEKRRKEVGGEKRMLTYPFGKACKEIFGKSGEPVYRRGQVYRVRQSQVTGSEQAGGRPAVIVSNDIGNDYSTVMGTGVPEGIPAGEAPGMEPENMDYDGLTQQGVQQTESPDTEGQAETETETETKSVRERAELNARIKHLADYASGEEANPDYRKIGYVYTEEMYYKLTGATELPDDWTDRMGPLMRGIITEEDEFVETLQTDDGAAQEQWLPAAVNTTLYQTVTLDGTAPEQAVAAVQAAQRKLGYPYSQARRDSGIAYDCSSLVYWSYLEAGVNIDPADGHTAASIARYLESMGRGISGGDLRPGDLIFYSYKNNGRYKNISHVAMVAGDGMMVHASSSKKMVVMTGVTLDRAVAVAHPVPDGTPETHEIPENAGDTIEDAKGSTQEPSQEADMSQYGPEITQGQEEGNAVEGAEPSDGAADAAQETTEVAESVSPVIITGMLQDRFIRAYYVSVPDDWRQSDGRAPGVVSAAWEGYGSYPSTGTAYRAKYPIQI